MNYIGLEVYDNYDTVFAYSAVEITPYAHNFNGFNPSELIKETSDGIRVYKYTEIDNTDDDCKYAFMCCIPQPHPLYNYYHLFYWYDQAGYHFPNKHMYSLNDILRKKLIRMSGIR